jgi:hypothetical protein
MIRFRVSPSVRLGRARIRVEWKVLDPVETSAEWRGTDRKVFYLNPRTHVGDVEKLDSVLHEITHLIEEKAGREKVDRGIADPKDHSAIYRVIPPLAKFIIDNKDALFECHACRSKAARDRKVQAK